MSKKGSALLYVIFAILSCSIINIYSENFQNDYEKMKRAYTPPQ